jgi:hypothetical protein
MVSSIPSSEIEHDGCARVCRFALDLMKAVQGFNDAGPQHGQITLRVGISCGSVVAGVVGTKRYLFDMWGDAVNVAARMEQHGVPGQIQVTQAVVHNAGNDFGFESRGTVWHIVKFYSSSCFLSFTICTSLRESSDLCKRQRPHGSIYIEICQVYTSHTERLRSLCAGF